ncbi:MAG: cobyrinate a,c-diamide synthase, partial [Muribaculum sp.]|nr:cobyrinate a,c-diamide synthase [Muribaculum sp.]
MNRRNGFIISAPASATGKTTVALGVMRAMVEDKRCVAPFKTGPDYIDTQYHAVACGRPSVNLDTFFTPDTRLCDLFSRYLSPDDVAVVEGAMGLFDGYDRDRGSTADVARTLGLPVVLVVNAKSVSYSLAPLLWGFRNFDPSIGIAGVIFNRVGSEKHRSMIASAAADAGIEILGSIPMSADLVLPSRHLGLSLSDREEMDAFIARAAGIVRDNVDLERLAALSYNTVVTSDTNNTHTYPEKRLNIAVARDMAFSFIYPTTIDSFMAAG